MAIATRTVIEACESAKSAAGALATAPTATKDAALARLAELLEERGDEVLEANAADLADERATELSDALRDRLALDPSRIAAMAEGVRAIIALDDPIGEELERRTLDNGLDLSKVRVPLGRRRGDLRGAAERHRRLRRAVSEERQLDRPAGLELRPALQRRPGRARARGRGRCRACPRARSSCWPASAPSSSSWRPPRAWSSS